MQNIESELSVTIFFDTTSWKLKRQQQHQQNCKAHCCYGHSRKPKKRDFVADSTNGRFTVPKHMVVGANQKNITYNAPSQQDHKTPWKILRGTSRLCDCRLASLLARRRRQSNWGRGGGSRRPPTTETLLGLDMESRSRSCHGLDRARSCRPASRPTRAFAASLPAPRAQSPPHSPPRALSRRPARSVARRGGLHAARREAGGGGSSKTLPP